MVYSSILSVLNHSRLQPRLSVLSCSGLQQCLSVLSYAYEDERGIFPEIIYVMDLLLPHDFEPRNSDGEVESFQLVPIDDVRQPVIFERLVLFNSKVY